MSGNDFNSKPKVNHPQADESWTGRAQRMLGYYPEASAFIRRASQHFPVTSEHTQLLLHLWIEIDTLDALILPALDELNAELLGHRGVLDTTRGVSMRESVQGEFDGGETGEVVFEFTWSVSWSEGRCASVILSSDENGVKVVLAQGSISSLQHRVGYPVTRSALEEALTAVFVAEETCI